MLNLSVLLARTRRLRNRRFGCGLGLTPVHLFSIPITNASVNPAGSTSQALFVSDWAISQLWLFWLTPIAGAVIAGLIYKTFFKKD